METRVKHMVLLFWQYSTVTLSIQIQWVLFFNWKWVTKTFYNFEMTDYSFATFSPTVLL